jgi:hypothetical protein
MIKGRDIPDGPSAPIEGNASAIAIAEAELKPTTEQNSLIN